jgi:F-type H+-transporting ATPase subunit a
MAAHPIEDIFHHVRDSKYFDLPFGNHPKLPPLNGIQLTKFMVLQVVTGLLILLIFHGLARRIRTGAPARGGWWNFWEFLALYVRDNIVRPTIGRPHTQDHGAHDHGAHSPVPAGGAHVREVAHSELEVGHPADKYLPFIWTCFFYVLFCNLLGALPFLGSATGELNVTGALALVTVGAVIFYGSQRSGHIGFWKSLAPSMDLPGPMKYILLPMIWIIEFVGFVIKHSVLAIRLFANVMGGHTVIAVILLFIAMAAHSGNDLLYYAVLPASIFGQVAIGMLELLVAFLQAYIFAFLATVFIGMAVNPH